MLRSIPPYNLLVFYAWFYSIQIDGKCSFGSYKIDCSEKFIRLQYVCYQRTKYIGECHQYFYNLSTFFTFQLSYAVVGFYYFGRFYKYSFTRSRFVMYNPFYLPLKCRCYGYYKTSVTHGGGYIFFYKSFVLSRA